MDGRRVWAKIRVQIDVIQKRMSKKKKAGNVRVRESLEEARTRAMLIEVSEVRGQH